MENLVMPSEIVPLQKRSKVRRFPLFLVSEVKLSVHVFKLCKKMLMHTDCEYVYLEINVQNV